MLKALIASLMGVLMMGGSAPSSLGTHFGAPRLHEAALWQVAPAPEPASVATAAQPQPAEVPDSAPSAEVGIAPGVTPIGVAPAVSLPKHAPPVVAPPPAAPACGIACPHSLAVQNARIVPSASFPAKRVGPGSVALIPVGTIVVISGFVDNCNGRWYSLSDGASWVHESAVAGVIAPPRMVCSA